MALDLLLFALGLPVVALWMGCCCMGCDSESESGSQPGSSESGSEEGASASDSGSESESGSEAASESGSEGESGSESESGSEGSEGSASESASASESGSESASESGSEESATGFRFGCCEERPCEDFPPSVFLTLNGFGCVLDDTWQLDGGCSIVDGRRVIEYLGSFFNDDCEWTFDLECQEGANGQPDKFILSITIAGLGGSANDWRMEFAVLSCIPLHLISTGVFTTGEPPILPPGAETACGCPPPDSPSGEVIE